MQLRVIKVLENVFEGIGRFIARWPYVVIIGCLLCTALCSIGFLNLTFDADIYRLWDTNPLKKADGSKTVANKDWVSNNIVDNKRLHTLIFTTTEPDGNILTPTALKNILNIRDLIISNTFQNVSFHEICYR